MLDWFGEPDPVSFSDIIQLTQDPHFNPLDLFNQTMVEQYKVSRQEWEYVYKRGAKTNDLRNTKKASVFLVPLFVAALFSFVDDVCV